MKNNDEQRRRAVSNQSENRNTVVNKPDDSTHVVICEDCQMPYAPKYWPLLEVERPVCYECREKFMEKIEDLTRALGEKNLAAMLGLPGMGGEQN